MMMMMMVVVDKKSPRSHSRIYYTLAAAVKCTRG